MASTSEPDSSRSASPQNRRTIHVPATRLVPWVSGFGERHGGYRLTAHEQGLNLLGDDDHRAEITLPFLPWSGTDLDDAARHLAEPRRVAVLVVRRGGYVTAVVDTGSAPDVVRAKRSTRRVQGRTAAGGWSQQRYARRRGKQTDELVDAAVRSALEQFTPEVGWLLTGGDRALSDQVLTDARLARVARLPRLDHLGQIDPDRRTVEELPNLVARLVIRLQP